MRALLNIHIHTHVHSHWLNHTRANHTLYTHHNSPHTTHTRSYDGIRITCFSGCANARGAVYIKCDGLKESDQSRCRARNCDGACSWLPQLVRAAEDEVCCVDLDHPDDHRLLRFDPCGCLLGLDSFTMQVKMHATSGLGEGRIAKSPVTGQFAFACPMGHQDSFVHDIRKSSTW